eukprot:NODE_387_length_1712_cov_282.833434_g306_i0.p1 GENE.NODE_387_length_1712_cov_282.833434_g306_i0~~NODE_387_length_1712_cov_282.833434_g306_i0.p1  ORF type:complete len:407 (+),score=55.98 NODE_387_length_1712_cov_282.833434_g306_i0:323-1543(+)
MQLLQQTVQDNGGYVNPKRDCPHVKAGIPPVPVHKAMELVTGKCKGCTDVSENWVCLGCQDVFCSRYVNGHMKQHNEDSGHPVAISLSDLNTWCYCCDSYITCPAVVSTYQTFHLAKFSSLPDENLAITTVPDQHAGLADQAEHEEEASVVRDKVDLVAALLRDCKRAVFFTGAGISTSAQIPDFRGPQGVWTLQAKGLEANGIPFEEAVPTVCHQGIKALQEHFAATGRTCNVVSQNIDGLHRRSGIPPETLSELHGNSFLEICWKCQRDYLRDSNITSEGLASCAECLAVVPKFCHCTKNICECGATLKDSIVHFGESLPQAALDRGTSHCQEADVCLVLGSSLLVSPANELPRDTVNAGGKLVLVNLQSTPLDHLAEPRIFTRADTFMTLLLEQLELPLTQVA